LVRRCSSYRFSAKVSRLAGSRVTNDHGYCPVFQILAKFSPNDENQSIAGCSVFGFAGGENFSGFRASGRDQALWPTKPCQEERQHYPKISDGYV
jgi:hypothetical protein